MPEGGKGVQGVFEGSEGLDEPILENQDAEEIDQDDAASEDETARETVERQYEILKEKNSRNEDAQKEPATKRGKAKSGVGEQQPLFNEPIPAPAMLKAVHKEAFNKLPPDLQRPISDLITNYQGAMTRATTEARRAQKDAEHIIETVRPYLLSHPELQAEGFTEAKIVSGLLAAHQRLTNPETAIQAYAELGMQIGLDEDKVSEILGLKGGGAGSGVDISKHPDFIALQNKLNSVTSYLDGTRQQQVQSVASRAVASMEEARNQTDASGRYLYPELHDVDFLERTKSLVPALAKNFPELDDGALLVKARNILVGQDNGSLAQVNQPRLPQQSQPRVSPSAANVSVRGKSAPIVSGQSDDDIPEEALASPAASAAWALKQLRRG
jgi:hypothetical protein